MMKRQKDEAAVVIADMSHGRVVITANALEEFLRKKTRKYGTKGASVSITSDGGVIVRERVVIPPGTDETAVSNALKSEVPKMLEKLGVYVSAMYIEVEKKKNVFQIGR